MQIKTHFFAVRLLRALSMNLSNFFKPGTNICPPPSQYFTPINSLILRCAVKYIRAAILYHMVPGFPMTFWFYCFLLNQKNLALEEINLCEGIIHYCGADTYSAWSILGVHLIFLSLNLSALVDLATVFLVWFPFQQYMF